MDWLRKAVQRTFASATTSSASSVPLSIFKKPIHVPRTSTLPPQVLIQCVPNNIFVTVSSQPGHTLFKLSAGLIGMKNGQKTSPKGSMAMVDALVAKLGQHGIKTIRLNFRGINAARPLIVSQLRKVDMTVTEIVDTTGIPFNGCRPKKARRG